MLLISLYSIVRVLRVGNLVWARNSSLVMGSGVPVMDISEFLDVEILSVPNYLFRVVESNHKL